MHRFMVQNDDRVAPGAACSSHHACVLVCACAWWCACAVLVALGSSLLAQAFARACLEAGAGGEEEGA
eukprot:15156029-Alexandrium_andersonii.AAC.1